MRTEAAEVDENIMRLLDIVPGEWEGQWSARLHVHWLGVALVTCRSQTAEGQRVALVGSGLGEQAMFRHARRLVGSRVASTVRRVVRCG